MGRPGRREGGEHRIRAVNVLLFLALSWGLIAVALFFVILWGIYTRPKP